MHASFDHEIVSDGSRTHSGEAGVAVIVRRADQTIRYRLTALVGRCSSSDAELLGSVIGLSLLAVGEHLVEAGVRVIWRCDNQTVVRVAGGLLSSPDRVGSSGPSGASEESGLRAAFRVLARRCEVSPVCIAAGGGEQRLLDACDRSSRWAAKDGARLLARFGEGPIGRLGTLDPSRAWHLVDLREVVRSLLAGEISRGIDDLSSRLRAVVR